MQAARRGKVIKVVNPVKNARTVNVARHGDGHNNGTNSMEVTKHSLLGLKAYSTGGPVSLAL